MFVSLQFKLELRREDKEKLIKLMRKQSSAIRVAYNMLKGTESSGVSRMLKGAEKEKRERMGMVPKKGKEGHPEGEKDHVLSGRFPEREQNIKGCTKGEPKGV